MSLETAATPWTHDELQLMGAELGDTVRFINEENHSQDGVIIMLNKMTIYALTENKEIVRFGRTTLMSLDNRWEITGLADQQIRISAAEWKKAKDTINATFSKKELNR